MKNVIVQGLGYVGLICMMASFQSKEKKQILILQFFSGLLFSIHLFMLNALSASVINLIVCFRTYIFSIREKKKWADDYRLPYVFALVLIVAGFLTYDKLYSIIPTICMVSNTFSTWYGSSKAIRIVGLALVPLWFVYDFMVGSYPGMTNDIFMGVSIIIGIMRYDFNVKVEKG